MSSYSKQMMGVAIEWLKVNLDRDSPFLNVPGLDKSAERKSKVMADREKARRIVSDPTYTNIPDLVPAVQQLSDLLDTIDRTTDQIIEGEKQLVEAVNEVPRPTHNKSTVDDQRHTDLGRWCLAWGRDGFNVFTLSPDFTAAMLLTDPSDIDIASVRLPFKGILLIIPDQFAVGAEGRHYTKIHICELSRSHIEQLDVANKIVDAMKGADRLTPQDRDTIAEFVASMPRKPSKTIAEVAAEKSGKP